MMEYRFALALALERSHLHVLVSSNLDVLWVAPVVAKLGGYEPEELIGRNATELIHPDDLITLADVFAYELSHPLAGDANRHQDIQAIRYRVRLADKAGGYTTFSASGTNLLAHPDVQALSIILRVETYRQCLDDALEAIVTDQPFEVVSTALSRACSVAFGPESSAMIIVNGVDVLGESLHQEGPGLVAAIADFDERLNYPKVLPSSLFVGGHALHPAGRSSHHEAWLVVSRQEAPTPHSNSVCIDIARILQLGLQHRDDKASLERAAAIDPLTGALNRSAFRARFESEVASSNGAFALLACDLDGFKLCNDEFGHPIGDVVLIQVVERIRRSLRKSDLVGRFGGDEFFVMLSGATEEEALTVAGRIAAEISAPFTTPRGRVTVGISIGAALGVGQSFERAIEQADEALYQAKFDRSGVVLAAA